MLQKFWDCKQAIHQMITV